MSETLAVKAIGQVRCPRTEPIDDDWDVLPAVIELNSGMFDADALLGLDTFSHVEVIYLFHRVPDG